MLLLVVSILTVCATEAGPTDVNLWGSLVTDITANISGSNNCSVATGGDLLDTFIVGSDCVATAIKTGDSYLLVARADSGSGDGQTYHGKVLDFTPKSEGGYFTLQQLVKAIYTNESVNKYKSDMMKNPGVEGAISYELKAGSSSNALYVYGGYKTSETDTSHLEGVKIDYDATKHVLTYSGSNSEFASTVYQLINSIVLEISPNKDAFKEKSEQLYEYIEKHPELEESKDFEEDLLEVLDKYFDVDYIFLSENLYNDMIVVVNNALDGKYNQATSNNNNNNNSNNNNPGNLSNPTNSENPNTGAFVNIFAIVALISVGTVLILGNKRKLFKI